MKDFLSILFFSNLSIIENIKQLKNLQIQKTTWDKIFVNFIKSKSLINILKVSSYNNEEKNRPIFNGN